jgi:hypothetical protein
MLKSGVSVQSNSDGPGREKDNKICKQQNFTSEYNGGTPAVRYFFKKEKDNVTAMLDLFLNHSDPHIFKLPWMCFFFLHVLGLPFHVIESELLEPPYAKKFQELFGVHEVHRNFLYKKTISCRNKEKIIWFLQEISGFFF